MASHLIPLHLDQEPLVVCQYCNSSSDTQIVRISNIDDWYFERVVSPNETLFFEAPQSAQLEVYAGSQVAYLRVEPLVCQRLQLQN